MMGFSLGLNIKLDPTLTETVKDWSDVRSPSRARRRLRSGKRHHFIPLVERARPDIYQMGNTLIMHPDTWARMQSGMNKFNRAGGRP